MRAGSASYRHQSRGRAEQGQGRAGAEVEQSRSKAGVEQGFPWAGLHHPLIGGQEQMLDAHQGWSLSLLLG